MNTITLENVNLGRDPELRYAGDKPVVSFSVADTRSWKDKSGEWQEETSWFNVSAWDALAENAAASLTKGCGVNIVGRMKQRTYTTKEGEERTVYEITATSIGPSLKKATAVVERNNTGANNSTRQAPAAASAEEPF